MSKAIKSVEKARCLCGQGRVGSYEPLNRISPNPAFTPSGVTNPS